MKTIICFGSEVIESVTEAPPRRATLLSATVLVDEVAVPPNIVRSKDEIN